MKISFKELAVAIGLAIVFPFTVSYLIIVLFNIDHKTTSDIHKWAFNLQEIIGAITMLIGAVMPVPTSISFGLILGGALCMVSAYGMHWMHLLPAMKIIGLVGALVILLYLGYALQRSND